MTDTNKDQIDHGSLTIWTNKLVFQRQTTSEGEPYYWLMTGTGTHIATIFPKRHFDTDNRYVRGPLTIEVEPLDQLASPAKRPPCLID